MTFESFKAPHTCKYQTFELVKVESFKAPHTCKYQTFELVKDPFTVIELKQSKIKAVSGTAERNFVWGGYSPFLKSLLCVKLKSTIYGKIIGVAIAPLAPLLRVP